MGAKSTIDRGAGRQLCFPQVHWNSCTGREAHDGRVGAAGLQLDSFKGGGFAAPRSRHRYRRQFASHGVASRLK